MGAVPGQLIELTKQLMGVDRIDSEADLTKVVRVAEMIRDAGPPDSGPAREVLPELSKMIGGASIEQSMALGQGLEQMRTALADLGKEINFSFANAIPSALGFNVFDLAGPARVTAPVYAPIRQKIPRTNGNGPSALAKVIRGFSGSGTGGIGSVNPAFNLTVPTFGASSEASRGNAVSYATGDVIVPFKWHALYDAVTWTAFFAGEQFQDLRAMSAALLMQMAFLGEERAILMGRDAVIPTPAAPTGTGRAVVAGETGITGVGVGGTNCYIKVSAVGAFGETIQSAAVTVNIAVGVTQVIDVTITDVVGALAYNVYASLADAGGADPGDASRFFYGTTGFNKFTLGADGRVSTGATSPTVDSGTGGTNNYRGLIQTVEEGPASGTSILGYSKRTNAKLTATDTSIKPLQDAFASMWSTAKASPDEVWVNAREQKNFSEAILKANPAAYRIAYDPSAQNEVIAGIIVSTVLNESTRKAVKLTVHPWLPVGTAVIASYALPFPTPFGQTTTMEVKGPQDYMQVTWPLTSMRYESSIVWFNALCVYAPTFLGVIHGIAQETDATVGRLQ